MRKKELDKNKAVHYNLGKLYDEGGDEQSRIAIIDSKFILKILDEKEVVNKGKGGGTSKSREYGF